MPKDKIER